jgi:drug/metabolite transporter (DMT)-like permease
VLLLVAAMATVGSTPVASRMIAGGLPPFAATALRFAVALPILLGLARVFGGPPPRLGRRDLLLLAGQAALGSVGYTVLMIAGVSLTAAADAGVVAGTLPAAVGLLAALLLGERMDRRRIAAIALATAGVATVTLDGRAAGGGGWEAAAGNALVLGAVVCEGLFLLLQKRLRAPVGPLHLATAMSGFGLLIALGPAAAEIAVLGVPDTTPAALAGVVWYALVPTVGGFVLWYAGAARTTGADAALATAVMPVTAVLLAALVLAEPVGAAQLVGMACVVAAVVAGTSGARRG